MGRYLALACVLLCAGLLTAVWRRISERYAMLDLPNVRSSHQVPTPRGAGVAIIAAFLPVPLIMAVRNHLDAPFAVALVGGGSMVAIAGILDDYRSLAAGWRLLVHLIAASLAVAAVGPPPELLEYSASAAWYWGVVTISVLAITWHVNLYNFMDGIDGIAGSQAVFVACAGAYFSATHGEPSSSYLLLCLAAACAGFLPWNWPPARVFMGDVGSGFLGYVLAVFALAAAAAGAVSIWTWVILTSAFIADATVTLFRRLLRGERVHEAHRSHAYQWSARRFHSHAKVTIGFLLVDVLWLLPMAWASTLHPERSAWIALAAGLPLLVIAGLLGAGSRESAPA